MANGVTIVFGGDDAGMIQAFQAVLKEQAKAEAATKKMNAAYRETAKEAAALEREAKKIFESTKTPMEQYTAQLKRLDELHKRGKISAETHRRAAVDAMDRLAKQSRVLSAEEQEALRKKQIAADEARRKHEELGRSGQRVWEQTRTPLERYNAKLVDLKSLLRDGAISHDTYRRAVARAKEELNRAGEAGQEAFGTKALSMLSRFGAALGITGGIAGAIMLVRKEYQNLIEVQKEAARLSMDVAQAQETALINLGAETPKERESFIASVKKIASETGVSERSVYLRASEALSARGDASVAEAMRAVKASIRYSPGDEQAGIAAAGAALGIGRMVGGATPEEAIGYMQTVGRMARVTDPRRLAVNFPPAMAAVLGRGGDPRTAGALYAAMTLGMEDPMGESSRTATIALAEQLGTLVPGRRSPGEIISTLRRDAGERQRALGSAAGLAGTLPLALADPSGGMMTRSLLGAAGLAGTVGRERTLAERIIYLQTHPAAFKEFMEKASFEKRAGIPVEQLLSGKGPVAETFAALLPDVPDVRGAGRLFERRVGVRRGAELQKTAELDRALDAAIEGLAMADPMRARLGLLREKFQPLLKQAGMGATAAMLEELAKGDASLASYRASIENQQYKLLHPRSHWDIMMQSHDPRWVPRAQPTETDRKQAEVLERLLDVLRDIERNTSQSASAAQRRGDPATNHRDAD